MLFVKKGPNMVDVSMRSINVSVRGLAIKYGGGGHEFASGCVLKSEDQIADVVREAEEIVAKAKQEMCHEESIKVKDPDSEVFVRMNDAILQKNPVLMEEAEQLIEDAKVDRSDAEESEVEEGK